MFLQDLEWTELDAAALAPTVAVVLGDSEEEARKKPYRPVNAARGRTAQLPFYRTFRLVWLKFTVGNQTRRFRDVFLLVHPQGQHWLLDGSSAPLHDANEVEKLALAEDQVAPYMRFFCWAVHGDEGPFNIIEPDPPIDRMHMRGWHSFQPLHAAIASHCKPMSVHEVLDKTNGSRSFRAAGTLIYGKGLFSANFGVQPDGQTEMTDDEQVADDLASNSLPDYPAVGDVSDLRSLRWRGSSTVQPARQSVVRAASRSISKALPADPVGAMAHELLTLALLGQTQHRLLRAFNAGTQATTPIEEFARLIVQASPIVCIESSIPNLEEGFLAAIKAADRTTSPFEVVRAMVDSDRGRTQVSIGTERDGLVLLTLLGASGLDDAESLIFRASRQNLAIVAICERASDLPEPLRRAMDLRLQLPPLTWDIFAAVFRRSIGAPVPVRRPKVEPRWVRHVRPADFERPRRLALPAAEAFAYIRDSIQERSAAVSSEKWLSLKQLHGLGEARRFAQDLIADIHAAIAGKLRWEDVDRGVLLVGPPGTGKTTLARAIARDCGVKFLAASAASWQATNHLGEHIKALRETFAEARQYSPAIVFIDEIDSLGNRENFVGHGAQYQTEVVNAVLEQIQGMDPAAPVFVIGATNDESRVDPALRRAGRLDRVIRIPYPNSDALGRIYRHYLGPHPVDDDVDTVQLGRISVGLTGADVEKLVRGALRRARQAGRDRIRQSDLVAEVVGSPREGSIVQRLAPAELRRVAVHESGHVLADFLGPDRGRDLALMSVIPRADGSLGLVLNAPSSRAMLTRSQYLAYLERALAGRAAEEIVFGQEGISGGCALDLAMASRVAREMVCRIGFGPTGTMLVTENPAPAQMEAAEHLLATAYSQILAKLRREQHRLERLAAALESSQELTGEEARKVLGMTRSGRRAKKIS